MRGTDPIVAAIVLGVLGAVCAPASARDRIAIDLPAGRAGQQLLAVGAKARINIIVRDRTLWLRAVPALRGRMTAAIALERIAAAAGARIVTLAPGSVQFVPRPVPTRPRAVAARPDRSSAVPPPPGPRDRQDIVVTASKRGVSRHDFAGQASWVSGGVIGFGGAGGSDRIVDRLTSVVSTYLGAGRNKLFIRGIADSSFTGATQPTVGQYFGDLRLVYTGPDPGLKLIDLAGVEVLEGPQGTLYGAGSLGGLIRLVPNMPDLGRAGGTVSAGVSATRHGAPGGDIGGVVNLPLVAGRLALRLAAIADSEGGYIDKPLFGVRDANRTRTLGGRAALRLLLADGWTADLIGMAQRIRSADSQYADGEKDAARLSRRSSVVEASEAHYAQAQVAVAGRIGTVRVQSTFGVTATDLTERQDATVGDRPPHLFAPTLRTRMIANETRLWRPGDRGAGWLVGLSHVRNRTWSTRLLGPPDALAPTIGVVSRAAELTLYGEASRRLLAGLLATGGLRVSRTTTTGRTQGEREPDDPRAPAPISGPRAPAPIFGEAAGAPVGAAGTIVLPSAAVLVDLTGSTRGFIRYQRGFSPGGLAIADDRLRRFRGDGVETIEAGTRTTTAGPLQTDFAMTLAYTAWRDIQADFLDGTGLPSTANIGDGRILTFAVTAGLRLARGLRATAAVSYNESSIGPGTGGRSPSAGDGPLTEGLSVQLRRIPNVAPLTARLGATFERELDAGYTLKIDGWARYVGRSSLGIGPILGGSQGDYVDGALAARLGKGPVGVTVGVTNPADTRGNRFALGTPVTTGRTQVTPLRPRTVRIGVDMTF